jgi:RNA polymerase sigma-70 factor (ECF subfamily)
MPRMSSVVPDVSDDSEQYRRELVAHCYRLLGSAVEAEDAAQEAIVRAWRGSEGFEGRSTHRSWLYRIATNVCFDMRRAPQRRALPMDLSGPRALGPDTDIGTPLEQTVWIEPIHDSRVLPDVADPAESAVLRESVRLAFIVALQRLPPRQRAVLVLREVLDWSAAEVAELLGTSVDSVTSALARARSTMSKHDASSDTRPLDDGDRSLLDRYVAAFEAYDVTALVALLHEDATFAMPPYSFWMRGRVDIERWWNGPGRFVAIPGCCSLGRTADRQRLCITQWQRIGGNRLRCMCSRSGTAASAASATFSTPHCSPTSVCRPRSEPDGSPSPSRMTRASGPHRPASTSTGLTPADADSTRKDSPRRRAALARRATASTRPAADGEVAQHSRIRASTDPSAANTAIRSSTAGMRAGVTRIRRVAGRQLVGRRQIQEMATD